MPELRGTNRLLLLVSFFKPYIHYILMLTLLVAENPEKTLKQIRNENWDSRLPLSARNKHLFIASKKEKIVAFALVDMQGDLGVLECITALSDLKDGKKVKKELIKYAEKCCKKAKKDEMRYIPQKDAMGFFKKLGYKPLHKKMTPMIVRKKL